MRNILSAGLLGAAMSLSGCAGPELLMLGLSAGANMAASGAIAKSAAEKKADMCYNTELEAKKKFPNDPAAVRRSLTAKECPIGGI